MESDNNSNGVLIVSARPLSEDEIPRLVNRARESGSSLVMLKTQDNPTRDKFMLGVAILWQRHFQNLTSDNRGRE